jgi:hypothetical protein
MEFYSADIEMPMSGWNTLYKQERALPEFIEMEFLSNHLLFTDRDFCILAIQNY